MNVAVTLARPARRGLLLVGLAGVLWGTSGVAARGIYALADVSPITVAAFRLAFGAPVLLAVMRLSMGEDGLRLARSELALMLLVGAALGASQAC